MVGLSGLLVLAVAIAFLAAASVRCSSHFTDRLSMRVLAALVLFAEFATLETLALGVIRLGANPAALCIAAVATWAAARIAVAGSSPSVGAQIAGWAATADSVASVAAGVMTALGVTWTAFLAWNPYIGVDALTYHLSESAIWIHNGKPGSLVFTEVGQPVQAFPKGGEVFFTWFLGMARTPVVVYPAMVALWAACLCAIYVGLRGLQVDRYCAALAGVALSFIPALVAQWTGPNTDALATVWLVLAAAICTGALSEPKLAWVALVAAGLAVGTKTTPTVLAVILIATTFWHLRRRLKLSPAAVAVGGGGIVLAAVWPIQDLIVYGAPLYPFSSVPAGPAIPTVYNYIWASFLSDPAGAIRVAHVSGYVDATAGGILILVALPIVGAVAATRLRDLGPSGERSGVAVGCLALSGVGIVACLVWGASPFTGWSGHPGTEPLVLGGVRYLLPAFVPAVAAVGLASRMRYLRPWCTVVLLAAVGLDIWRLIVVGFPIRPTAAECALAVVIGAVVAYAAHMLGQRRRVPIPSAAWMVVPLALLTLTVPSNRYAVRHIDVSRATGVDNTRVLEWMSSQPGWTGTDAPVSIGPDADASFMGPHFQHPLTVLDANTPCALVRQRAATGWLILTAVPNGGVFHVEYAIPDCVINLHPAFVAGLTSVYAPPNLLK